MNDMDIAIDLGGRPGIDCKGFCTFCYFKCVEKVEPIGCKLCKPFKKGCDYCSRDVIEIKPGFKPFDQVIYEFRQQCMGRTPDKITIWGNGDISCYSQLLELVNTISGGEVPVFLDYTSGKDFSTGKEAADLIEAGVTKLSFSIFSTNSNLRRKFVKDRHPEEVLSNLRTFCENCDVYAMVVLIPGVNDGPMLEKTCEDLVEMGAKGLMLMIFANTRKQGLIFGNAPIIPGVIPHTVNEIRKLATDLSEKHDMRIIGTPLWDPHTGAPFALAYHKNELKRLPRLENGATLVASSLSYPFLSSIFQELGDTVNVVKVEKEIGNLITLDDFEKLDINDISDRVIIPGKVLAHDRDIRRTLRRDGRNRLVFRGPDDLTVESEESIYMSPEQVLDIEIEAFAGLIEQINELGN
jgi:methanogenesis marker radical SAM protein